MNYVIITSAESKFDFKKETNKALVDIKKNIKSLCKNLIEALPDNIDDIDEGSASNITDMGNDFRTKLSLVSNLISNIVRIRDGISDIEKKKRKEKDKKKLSRYDELLEIHKEEVKMLIKSITKAL